MNVNTVLKLFCRIFSGYFIFAENSVINWSAFLVVQMTIPRIQNVKLISECLAPGWFSCIALAEEKNREGRGRSCQSVRRCGYLTPVSSTSPASSFPLQAPACISTVSSYGTSIFSCCAPNPPHGSPSPLPHCLWSFLMSNSFPSMSNPKMSPPWTDSFSLFLILWIENCKYSLFGIYHMNRFHIFLTCNPV